MEQANAPFTTSFKGAWVSVWEKESCSDLYGEMEVVADDLPGLAEGIINYYSK